MKIIRELEGSYSSEVYLVEINSKKFIYKKSDISGIIAEKYLQQLQKKNDLPFLILYDENDLEENELIIEYVSGSKTLASSDKLELYEQFGSQLKKIHAIGYHSYLSISHGQEYSFSHQEFIAIKIQEGIQRIERKKSGLDIKITQKIVTILERLKQYVPLTICYNHGDLHSNNVLLRNDELVFFDPWGDMISCDPYWDLALVYIEYFEKEDSKKLDAILRGYDTVLDIEKLDYYILLRAFNRYPNPFEKNLLTIIQDKICFYT